MHMDLTVSPSPGSIWYARFVVNATSDSFPLNCRGSGIRNTHGFGLRSERTNVRTIAWNKNKLPRRKLSWFEALPSWLFSTFTCTGDRAGSALCALVALVLLSGVPVLLPFYFSFRSEAQCFFCFSNTYLFKSREVNTPLWARHPPEGVLWLVSVCMFWS